MRLRLFTFHLSLFIGLLAMSQTSADFMRALPQADVDIAFDVTAKGQEYRVAWGMDAAWNWDLNISRGVAHIGKENLSIGRVAFQPTELVTDNGDGTYELTTAQKTEMKSRCDNIRLLTGVTTINMTADQEVYYPNATYVSNYYGKVEEWYKLIKASVKYCREIGMQVYSISPYNEPDYTPWKEGTQEQYVQLCQLLRQDPYFDGIDLCGANTLNCDQALPWYNEIKTYLGEGNTHQLAGTFDNYASFFQQVRADGKTATADELHNVGEAIVGVNYGMQRGIWWGFDSKARGQFCQDSNEGVRIGYGENRSAWTSGAVYRNEKTGEVHGYLGSSERQAKTSSFAFVSTTRDVYFNGYGPTRMYVYDVPGDPDGKYQGSQINAERLFDITWGEDVAPSEVNGTYLIMNASSKCMLTSMGEGRVQTTSRKSSGTTQQWNVYPSYTSGDISYWFIDNVTTNAKRNLNVLNNNLNANAGVICWDANHDQNEQWYLKYAQDGYYYIISRLSNKYLYCPKTTNGTEVTLQSAPTENMSAALLKRYLWRFQPIDSKAETAAPAAPTGLKAKRRPASVELTWTAPEDKDELTYTVLRAEAEILDEDGEDDGDSYMDIGSWETIGRNISGTSFVDNLTNASTDYAYKVIAVDYAGNRSAASEQAVVELHHQKAILCQLQFDGTLTDNSPNRIDVKTSAEPTYSNLSRYTKSGTKSLNLNGNYYAQLPYAIANQTGMTVSTWVRWSGTGGDWQRIFDFGNGTSQYMFLTPSNGSEMRFVMKNGGDEEILSTGKKLATDWHHVAITLSYQSTGKTRAILYLDGQVVAERNDILILPDDIRPSLCYIGRSMFPSDPLFKGYIDDFRIYNYALTADEIAAVMTDIDPISKDIKDIYEETVSTGIQAPTANDHRTQGTRYDLSGKPASEASKGIVIQGGKKVYQR